jgi:hypothetical protein
VEGLVVVVLVMAGVMVALGGGAWVGGWVGRVAAGMVKVVREVKVGMEVEQVEVKEAWEEMVVEMGLVERVEGKEGMGLGVGLGEMVVKVVVLVG